MNKFLTLTEAQRRTVFEQTAANIKLPVASIEKDFWVTEILNILFSLTYADKMVVQGWYITQQSLGCHPTVLRRY